jgi:acyl carrier protein
VIEQTAESTRIEDRLRSFIAREVAVDLERELLNDDFPLVDSGALDSLGLFEIVAFIEDEFGVAVEDLDLVYENFQDVRSIARFVGSKVT